MALGVDFQTYNGGSAMTQFLRAIWPSYWNIENKLPESAGSELPRTAFFASSSSLDKY